jgi:hypothetical protein
MSFGREFRIKEGVTFNVRAEFTNVFNRTPYRAPDSTNAQATQRKAADGTTISGFGRISSSC